MVGSDFQSASWSSQSAGSVGRLVGLWVGLIGGLDGSVVGWSVVGQSGGWFSRSVGWVGWEGEVRRLIGWVSQSVSQTVGQLEAEGQKGESYGLQIDTHNR